MRTLNCRLNPTTNGPLHLGHIYTALVNRDEAKRSGGRFLLRFDDNQESWLIRQPGGSAACAKQIIKDLALFDLIPDEVISQVEQFDEMMRFMLILNKGPLNLKYVIEPSNTVEMIGKMVDYHAYSPIITAEKVVYDYMSFVSCLIRGEDLITESVMYMHFQEIWCIGVTRQVYLPRLINSDGTELSKTHGGGSIQELIGLGYTIDNIMAGLRSACLVDTKRGWYTDNIKPQPIIGKDLTWSGQVSQYSK